MPKLIDYPRTSYSGAWEVAEVVDDTGGKCAIETCARKLNRKVSGSFKAIIGSAVKFGLLTSKREVLTTTTLFRRIKHAYDKQEELLFHREAFLTPPLFTQLCRKFRSRELPVAMLDVLLIREFGVEEINAQGVAKAFVDGAHMVGVLDENNVITDIDQLAAQQGPRRELASPALAPNVFRQIPAAALPAPDELEETDTEESLAPAAPPATSGRSADRTQETAPASPEPQAPTTATPPTYQRPVPTPRPAPAATSDAIANLFGLGQSQATTTTPASVPVPTPTPAVPVREQPQASVPTPTAVPHPLPTPGATPLLFRLELAGPGINTQLEVTEAEDLLLVRALLDKIERQLKR